MWAPDHVESFFSHLKGDWPHLTSITDPAALDAELARIRDQYNKVRLHAAIGYVTPDDEHHVRGPRIRRARIAGLKRAHAQRIKENRRREADGAQPLVSGVRSRGPPDSPKRSARGSQEQPDRAAHSAPRSGASHGRAQRS